MNVFKVSAILFFSSLLFTSCVTGKYVSKPTGDRGISQAPMKLKMCGKAQYTYYAYSNSAVEMYQENAKYKKKGDTIFMQPRTYYGDTTEVSEKYTPKYLVAGDSLISLEYNMMYVKK
ncbi:MAG: hypothetical protein NXI10_17650 [bacterium]|nr:hypothetical protein [bacterium]